MKIKDYRCKCGHDDFFFIEYGNNMGIYCTYCGKWNKWADKDERNLSMKQEQKTGSWKKVSAYQYKTSASYAYKCSICGEISWYASNFCPDCGADMRGVGTI